MTYIFLSPYFIGYFNYIDVVRIIQKNNYRQEKSHHNRIIFAGFYRFIQKFSSNHVYYRPVI